MLSMTALTAITTILATASVVHLIYMCFQLDCCFELRLRGWCLRWRHNRRRLQSFKRPTYPCLLFKRLELTLCTTNLQFEVGFSILPCSKKRTFSLLKFWYVWFFLWQGRLNRIFSRVRIAFQAKEFSAEPCLIFIWLQLHVDISFGFRFLDLLLFIKFCICVARRAMIVNLSSWKVLRQVVKTLLLTEILRDTQA